MRIVASLTTVPGRYDKLYNTLLSLHSQDKKLDAIYLGLPKESRRLHQVYPDLPDNIKNLCTIVPCEDYGPMTKIVGALLSESDSETIIFIFDDDRQYSPNTVSTMLNYHLLYPNIAIGSGGILLKYPFPFYGIITNNIYNHIHGPNIPDEGLKVDIFYGYSSVLYIRKFFPIYDNLYEEFFKFSLLDENIYFNDDVLIPAILSKNNIERRIFKNIPPVDQNLKDSKNDNFSISNDFIRFYTRLVKAINKTKKLGFFKQTADIAITDTFGATVFIVFLVLLFFIFFIFFDVSTSF